MRAALALLLVAGLGAACSSTVHEAGSCAATLDWNGVRYQGNGYRLPPELGERLGDGVVPGCDDGGGASGDSSADVYAIEGVEPSVAVALAEGDAVYLAPEYSRADAMFPEALQPVIFGPSCSEAEPFVVEGELLGAEDTSFALEVEGFGPYGGLELTVAVSPDAVVPSVPLSRYAAMDRLRARVRCVEADLPDDTFSAEEVSFVGNGFLCGQFSEPCHASEGPPHPGIAGGSPEQRALLEEIVTGLGPSMLTRIEVRESRRGVELAAEAPRPVALRAEWEAWLVAGAFRDGSLERGLPRLVGLAVGDTWMAIQGGPWNGGVDDPRTLSREVHRASGRSGIHFDPYALLRPAGVAPAITFRTGDGAEFLTTYLPRFLEELGDPWRYEGFYLRVEGVNGERIWEWAGSSRLATGGSGTKPGLEGCNPIQQLGSSMLSPSPPDCPAG